MLGEPVAPLFKRPREQCFHVSLGNRTRPAYARWATRFVRPTLRSTASARSLPRPTRCSKASSLEEQSLKGFSAGGLLSRPRHPPPPSPGCRDVHKTDRQRGRWLPRRPPGDTSCRGCPGGAELRNVDTCEHSGLCRRSWATLSDRPGSCAHHAAAWTLPEGGSGACAGRASHQISALGGSFNQVCRTPALSCGAVARRMASTRRGSNRNAGGAERRRWL